MIYETLILNVLLLITGFSFAQDVRSIRFVLDQPLNPVFVSPEKSAAYIPGSAGITHDALGFFDNGQPVFFHGGEIQYFRIPEEQWEDVILKAKNGGLNCIATCVYWGIHEPKDNVWNFEGRYDIKRFLSICRKHGLYVILRIGPIINAETRNAGLPQWVREKLPGAYHHLLYPTPSWFFKAVADYYSHLAAEINGYFPSKGGNIALVQIDNETNCSWIWGRAETQKDAQVTIDTYQELAKKAGFEGPFTSTYWEPTHAVRAKGSIPGTGAYPLGNWHLDKAYPTFNGFNLSKTNHFTGFKDTLNYPVLSIENQGGGGYYTITPPEFPAYYNLADIASGVNATSYYIYGAGTNPQRYPGPWFSDYVGKSVARPDVTRMSYDLHSPLGEFQQVRESYAYIRRLGMFLNAFGGSLQHLPYQAADSVLILGRKNQVCMRQKEGSGFLFLNSYVLPDTKEKEEIQFQLISGKNSLTIPVKSRLHAYQNKPLTIPIRLKIAGVNFRYATANPLTILNDKNFDHLLFYANGNDEAEFCLEGITKADILAQSGFNLHLHENCLVALVDPAIGSNVLIINRKNEKPLVLKVFTEQASLQATFISGVSNKLFLTGLVPLEVNNGSIRLEYTSDSGTAAELAYYPAPGFSLKFFNKQLVKQPVKLDQPVLPIAVQPEKDGYSVRLKAEDLPKSCKEIYLNISPPEYGRGAELFADGMMVADSYYHLAGDSIYAPWCFGLKRFLNSHTMQWVIEKQPGGSGFKIFNKFRGSLIGVKDGKLCMLPDDDGENTIWQMDEKEEKSMLKHIGSGKYLTYSGNKTELVTTPTYIWTISHSDDFYQTISNGRKAYLCLTGETVAVNNTKREVTFDLKSYKFVVSLKDFTFKRVEGIYTKPESYSFLMEKKFRVKDLK